MAEIQGVGVAGEAPVAAEEPCERNMLRVERAGSSTTAVEGMVVMACLPSRWDSGDEAAVPHTDETITVGTPTAGDVSFGRRSVRLLPPAAPQAGNAGSRPPVAERRFPQLCAAPQPVGRRRDTDRQLREQAPQSPARESPQGATPKPLRPLLGGVSGASATIGDETSKGCPPVVRGSADSDRRCVEVIEPAAQGVDA